MAQTNINIRIDSDLKKQAEALFSELGLNMTTRVQYFCSAGGAPEKNPF